MEAQVESLGWERRKGEGAKAYGAFRRYRELGSGRSLGKFAAVESEVSGALAADVVEWAVRFAWAARVAEWDEHVAGLAGAERAAAREGLAARREAFELKNQERLEARVEKAEALLDRADGEAIVDTAEERSEVDPTTGRARRVARKAKGLSLAGYSRLMKAVDEAARQAVVGVRGDGAAGVGEGCEEPRLRAEFVWVKPRLEEPSAAG